MDEALKFKQELGEEVEKTRKCFFSIVNKFELDTKQITICSNMGGSGLKDQISIDQNVNSPKIEKDILNINTWFLDRNSSLASHSDNISAWELRKEQKIRFTKFGLL